MLTAKAKIILVLLMAIIIGFFAINFIHNKYRTVIVDIPKFSHQPVKNQTNSIASDSLDTLYKIPNTLYLSVPFTPQAPTANWDQLHNEACEEAVSIMADSYYSNNHNSNLDPAYVESEISKLTVWEDQNLGYHLDTTSAETAQMIDQVYGLQTKLLNNFTLDQIKTELAQNHLVIISEYGRALGNPYYKSPGPIHHMLLIKGYDSTNLITNDSGTKNGRSYIYSFDTIYSAAGDWSHATNNVDQTKKIAIVVWK